MQWRHFLSGKVWEEDYTYLHILVGSTQNKEWRFSVEPWSHVYRRGWIWKFTAVQMCKRRPWEWVVWPILGWVYCTQGCREDTAGFMYPRVPCVSLTWRYRPDQMSFNNISLWFFLKKPSPWTRAFVCCVSILKTAPLLQTEGVVGFMAATGQIIIAHWL